MFLSSARRPLSVRCKGNAELVCESAEDDVVDGLAGCCGLDLDRVPDLVRHTEKEDGAGARERALAPGRPVVEPERIC